MKENKFYVGLACSLHDSALAIVNQEGEILFAEATERYLQYKRALICPPDDFNRISRLIETHCDPQAQFIGATSWSNKARFSLKIFFLMGKFNPQRVIAGLKKSPEHDMLALSGWADAAQLANLHIAGLGFISRMKLNFANDKIILRNYDHHLTHAANGCYTSPFSEAVCAVIDGFGEAGALAIFHYTNGTIKPVYYDRGNQSLGWLYWLVTDLCGFEGIRGEEWKIMGLAPYGKRDETLYRLLKSYYRIKGCGLQSIPIRRLKKMHSELFEFAKGKKWPSPEVANLAATAQVVYAELAEEILHNVYKLNLSENLVFSGGCALNSSFNGQILERTPFKRLYIPSAPGDDGNALGAALLAYNQDDRQKKSTPHFCSPYLGSEIASKALTPLGKIPNTHYIPESICQETAQLLAEGKLVGWVQGRAEFGPRALGNRSILADPRSSEMKDKINAAVKFREKFRPFAPSILHEYGENYFENYQESPYMERTLRFKEEVWDKVPAVVHEDKTGRLQTVKKEWNSKYYELLQAFYQITGTPVLLNTSFNIMGKPIMHSLEDAVSLFFLTDLDVLVVGDYLIRKEK